MPESDGIGFAKIKQIKITKVENNSTQLNKETVSCFLVILAQSKVLGKILFNEGSKKWEFKDFGFLGNDGETDEDNQDLEDAVQAYTSKLPDKPDW